MNEDAKKAEIKRDEGGHYLSGNPPGPGRPKGQSMKEFWKQRLALMTEQEKIDWIKANKVAAEVIWKMSEGNPTQQTDVTTGGHSFLPTPEEAAKIVAALTTLSNDGRNPENS